MVHAFEALTEGDLWAMRGGVLFVSLYSSTYIVNPLIKKVFLERSVDLMTVLTKQIRFFTLVTFAFCIVMIYPFYDLMPHRVYYTSISFFVGLFALNETFISYQRVPFKLITVTRQRIIYSLVYFQWGVSFIRTSLDLITFILCFTGPLPDDFYIFIKAIRILSGSSFAASEFAIAKITLDLVSTPRADLTADMKLALKHTKSKLRALAAANLAGGLAGVIDIPNHWCELQMTQSWVLLSGAATFIFYGNLFNISLHDKEDKKEGTTKTTTATGTLSGNHSESSKTPEVESDNIVESVLESVLEEHHSNA